MKQRFDELNDVDLEISDSDDDDNDDSDEDKDDKKSRRKTKDNNIKKSSNADDEDNAELFGGQNFDTLIGLMRKFVAHESTLAGVETGYFIFVYFITK